MSVEKPWNDVADQLRPVEPDGEDRGLDEEAAVDGGEPASEADAADVADQRRVVPLPDDEPRG
jgi:hypothetical protein